MGYCKMCRTTQETPWDCDCREQSAVGAWRCGACGTFGNEGDRCDECGTLWEFA